jgi:hypothetical protein
MSSFRAAACPWDTCRPQASLAAYAYRPLAHEAVPAVAVLLEEEEEEEDAVDAAVLQTLQALCGRGCHRRVREAGGSSRRKAAA